MSAHASPIPLPPLPSDDISPHQPRRYSREALASRFANIGPLDAMALFAFEEALDACDATPYGLPHEWRAGDARPAPEGCYYLGMLGDDLVGLVSEARRVYGNDDGRRHLLLGLGRTDCGRIAVTHDLVDTPAPCGARISRATPEDIAYHHPWLSPTEMVALSSFLNEWCSSDVLLARHCSDVPHRMGIDIALITPREIADRISANLHLVRPRLERAHKTRSRVIVALQKTAKATILWYGATADAGDIDVEATPDPVAPHASTRWPTVAPCAALVQLPASRPTVDDPCDRKVPTTAVEDRLRLLVVDPQDPRDCAAVLSLYPDVSPDGLAVVFELDRALADLPRQWWSATSAPERVAAPTAHETTTMVKEVDLSKRQVKETAIVIRDAISHCVDQRGDDGVVAVLWARPSSNGATVAICYAPATTTRTATIDPDALALAAAADERGPSTTCHENAVEDRPCRGTDDTNNGGDDDDDAMPPLERSPQDLFDLVRLCPRLTPLQIAALSFIADGLKNHGICFAWLPTGLGRFEHTERVRMTRWGAEWAAQCIVNAYYATANLGEMIEIGVVQREDGGIDCMCAFVPHV